VVGIGAMNVGEDLRNSVLLKRQGTAAICRPLSSDREYSSAGVYEVLHSKPLRGIPLQKDKHCGLQLPGPVQQFGTASVALPGQLAAISSQDL
jgi:hypothetical protein